MNKKTVGILPFEIYQGKRKNWAGSSRIRGRWVVRHWDEAEEYQQGGKYDTVIYQKAYWIDHAKNYDGIKILDLCDPDWVHWEYKVVEMINNVDGIVTSTEALADTIRKFTDKPVRFIADRMDLDFYQQRKFHQGDAKWVVWYGYSSNFDLLKPVIPFLKQFKLDLIVIADQNFHMPLHASSVKLKNLPWNIDTINKDIIEGDIVVNPYSSKGKWKFKSNNKTVAAWALGMPVAHDVEDLKKFIKEEARKEEAKLRLAEVKEFYDTKISVKEYKDFIEELKRIKYGK